ncbi:hypothetical protein JTE90_008230 [Oedothorax gibbosus]|uniref:Ionotropic receptor n=1 Tax=Oedothorax gibbosus TaxID=931172 RepID=A0AAV6ULJ5_9ARAC|nr:hypothetical protein JTE90_008230 [Oedothorax gibbosus]
MTVFKVISLNLTKMIDMRRNENGSLYGIGGVEFHLLQILSSYFPFRYELMEKQDFVFGNVNDKGEWTGMMGMLKSGEVDMVVSRMAQVWDRTLAVDFSFPYLMDSVVFVTAAPKVRKADFPFIEPFQVMVWCLLLLSLVIPSMVICLLSGPKTHKETWISRWMTESYKLLVLLLGQGSLATYQKTRVQAFMYLWILSKLVLVFSYCSILLSFLMVPRMETPLRTVQELQEAVVGGKYQFTTFRGTSFMAFVNDSKTGVFKILGDHLRSHPDNVLSPRDNPLAKILSEHRLSILMSRFDFNYKASEFGSDRFNMPEDNFGHYPCGISMRKGLGMVERINRLIHRVTAAGIVEKQMEYAAFRNHLKYSKADSSPPSTLRSLSFTDIQTAVQILGAGLLAAVTAEQYRQEYIRDAFIRDLKCSRIRVRLLENTGRWIRLLIRLGHWNSLNFIHNLSYCSGIGYYCFPGKN